MVPRLPSRAIPSPPELGRGLRHRRCGTGALRRGRRNEDVGSERTDRAAANSEQNRARNEHKEARGSADWARTSAPIAATARPAAINGTEPQAARDGWGKHRPENEADDARE